MHSHRLLLVLALLALTSTALPSTALADPGDDTATTPAPAADAEPEHRVDVIIPTAGLGLFMAPTSGYQSTILLLGIEGRYAHRSGHGAMLRLSSATNGWGGATGGDLDYLYRVRLAGHQHVSLGLDLMAGLTVAVLHHNEALIPVGAHTGGNAGFSLDFRARNFVVGIGAQYRVLIPSERALNGGDAGVEHAATAALSLGFTFY